MATNLGYKVTTRDYSVLDLVRRYWGAEYNAPDHAVYEFSNGRKFDSTDKALSGIYGIVIIDGIEVQTEASHHYPDVYPGVLLDESGNKIGQDEV